MLNNQINANPVLIHVEPILAVRDVEASVIYWHDVLGFTYKWTWGDPPNHGGVSRDGVFIQFSLDPELASSSEAIPYGSGFGMLSYYMNFIKIKM
jgi:catechol 2,3-dioxygenase-like lactoylglutathione lyase family enzyme